MNIGSSHIGASLQTAAYMLAAEARFYGQQRTERAATERMGGDTGREVQPAAKLVETPVQVRSQVMAERGVDRLDLMKMGAQARLEAEISIAAEAAQRAKQAQIRTTGNFVDLRA